MIDSDFKKYIEEGPPEDIDAVREAVYAQFGPNYCVIATGSALRMFMSYFLLDRVGSISGEAAVLLAKMHGSVLKGGLMGAGLDAEDITKVLSVLRGQL